MGTAIKAKKSAKKERVVGSFRFVHRGARDYPGLLRHYRETFHLPQPFLVRFTGFSPRSVAKWSNGGDTLGKAGEGPGRNGSIA